MLGSVWWRKWVARRKGGHAVFACDDALARVADCVMDACEYVVALGGEAPANALHLAARAQDRECLACEHESDRYHTALNLGAASKNFYLYNLTPAEFLRHIDTEKPYLYSRDALVVLDVAGGGARRDVLAEMEHICGRFEGAFVLLVGCRVPGGTGFTATRVDGHDFSLRDARVWRLLEDGTIFYPRYRITGRRRGAVPGWGLATLGRNALYTFPDAIMRDLRRVE
ncbi:hypothetical protein ACI3L3_05660 [Desulfobaculum sp. SPO524]|uniref:hypothetical protein n=1 Tax=Desulfobaculum sp. SPO524 TaxID=3378071 RepID=UPI00385548E9